jgi:hypothetical protein
MSDMIELAVRCEAATGADRELDAEISLLCQTRFERYQMESSWQPHRDWSAACN